MPLLDLSGQDAVANRKGNAQASWGDRGAPNRVEPVTRPAFHTPFTLEPGEKIFTVGSCFARNVETERARRGFSLPMREALKDPAFEGAEVGVVNNFGTPSIYNEFAWAFGEKPFLAEDHIVETQAGKYVDLHVISSVRPEARPLVTARRAAINAAYAAASVCRVVIVTLGLVELWFDTRTGYYLNSAPRPASLRKEPDRFRLHVLSFEEAQDYLERALLLLRKHGHPDLRVLLTVSPVPLAATHRDEDVIVANCYSKSVLRAVAETATLKHDFVSYYPSYESVAYSDRRIAWRDDFIHVTDEIVALNVGRMVDAFTKAAYCAAEADALIAGGGATAAVEKAKAARAGRESDARAFFSEFGRFSLESVDFALEHAQFLISVKEWRAAFDLLARAPGADENDAAVLLKAEAASRMGRPQEAFDLLDKLGSAGTKSSSIWNALLRAAKETGEPDRVFGVLARWSRIAPSRAPRANALVGRWLHERGDVARAEHFLRHAVALGPEDALAQIYLVELLLATGRMPEAHELLASIDPHYPTEKILFERLRKIVPVVSP
jgi:thioredoxin-like negative regulator of GroEL